MQSYNETGVRKRLNTMWGLPSGAGGRGLDTRTRRDCDGLYFCETMVARLLNHMTGAITAHSQQKKSLVVNQSLKINGQERH